MPAGVLLIDKPQGMTSHDVVARVRRAAGTRKVGHAGTLDPMATGLLILGVDSATRLLHYIVGLDKEYVATIRLGQSSHTDDAEGELSEVADAESLSNVTDEAILKAVRDLTGDIQQVPSSVSAIKVDGQRAYAMVRAGEEVALAARAVTVHEFEVESIRRSDDGIDLDVRVVCSSGTYIRALARDLGSALGIGGHLTRLRRTRIGGFRIDDAHLIDELTPGCGEEIIPAATAAAAALPVVKVSDAESIDLGHGKRIPASEAERGTLAAAITADNRLVAVVESRGDTWKVATGFPAEGGTS